MDRLKNFFIGLIIMLTITNEIKALEDNVYVEKLKNGATLIVKPRTDTTAVSLQVWFSVGSVYENDNERGLSHFLEHMLFNGTKYTNPGEIEFEVEKKGGIINAATSFDFTYYYIEIGDLYWKQMLKYLFYMTTAPILSEEMIKKEKPIVLEELNRHLDNPKSHLWDTYNKLAYKVSNYKHPVIGYRETIEKFNEKLVKGYFNKHYYPKNTYIVVVGNVDKDEVIKEVENTFGTVKPKKEAQPNPEIPLEPPQKEIRKKILRKKQITRAYVAIGWQAPPIKDKESYVASILEYILAGGKSSVLYQQLREKGYVQGIYAGYMSHKGTSQFLFYFVVEPNKVEEAKEKLFDLIFNYVENGVPENLVEDAKRKIINSRIFASEEVSNEAENFGYAAALTGDVNYALNYIDNIKKVSKKDIDQYLRKYFKKDNYTEVQLLPEEEK
ncbi:M16 family metallopeptidase [Hydrogenothermus marinus]|uniref:Putative Zn-dependent peptidase n=1 Tax=Hydrogenothermus marinus TaxID=133270 RepID=A0A3M0BLY0_9AQUI|nr:pitrilysin family protein [Hydrogenothermus marinus]RMA97474.1 putative Zn-dependent peptidase [Hydrogenothermus marinus]